LYATPYPDGEHTWPRQTLLGKSRTPGKAALHRMKGGEIVYIPLVTLTSKTLEINHRDLTNKGSLGYVCSDIEQVLNEKKPCIRP
jgi:hypothetical protein